MPIQTVLLVDDEPDIRTVATLALGAVGGLDVTVAESGQVALELASRLRPDVIVLDMMMPGMDGLTTLANLRRDGDLAHIPVVFMTARVLKVEIERYLAAGAIGIIAKPFDPMTLAAELRRIVDEASSK